MPTDEDPTTRIEEASVQGAPRESGPQDTPVPVVDMAEVRQAYARLQAYVASEARDVRERDEGLRSEVALLKDLVDVLDHKLGRIQAWQHAQSAPRPPRARDQIRSLLVRLLEGT